jgi:glucosamine-6-phosphate deaminase
MRVIIVKDTGQLGKVSATLIAAEMKRKPTFVLGVATGTSPIPLYQEFIRLNRAKALDFSTTITFNLDEYVGVRPTHVQSYRYFMNRQLFDHVNINKKNTHVPDGMARDIEASCEAYERMIADVGGIDYQVLGIGSNGHIGFNEPGTSLGSRTHLTKLTESTITDNSRLFKRRQDVPTKAVTMGIGTILEAERILLLASGPNKADSIAKAVEGPITATVPASALQLHPRVTFVITEDAAEKLTLNWERA